LQESQVALVGKHGTGEPRYAWDCLAFTLLMFLEGMGKATEEPK